MAFFEREGEIIKTLQKLTEKNFKFIVVGGYAVSGLARHRFSVDCDIILSKRDSKTLKNFLEGLGFKEIVRKKGFDKKYGGEFISYKKEIEHLPITIDVMIDSLVCRNTDAVWTHNYILEHSLATTISGLMGSVICTTPEKELMIAFKIHSGRKTDIRDIIALNEGVSLEKIMSHCRRGSPEKFRTQLEMIINRLKDQSLTNSLKGVFSLKTDVEKEIEKTRMLIKSIFKEIC
ncbi:MAG: hypothetical protein ACTSRW_05680 [Candidatus Helarchaeota archaeon]